LEGKMAPLILLLSGPNCGLIEHWFSYEAYPHRLFRGFALHRSITTCTAPFGTMIHLVECIYDGENVVE
jgi:hypothetical protein